ncbi:PREDICTED: uncharacterized protein LOC105455587, partial [Wasmannia auropunctata]|uniref:uncharacterized protein LOC105455587 n=1 Tax=Wasmannia auropunctata TaxID=64793 RepID=UPI0005EFC0CA
MANFYVPIEAVSEKPPSSVSSNVPRILRRRLALTHTSYKWLDIGINAGPLSTIDLTIGDNRGNGIVLSYETWRALMDRRADTVVLNAAECFVELFIVVSGIGSADDDVVEVGEGSIKTAKHSVHQLLKATRCRLHSWLQAIDCEEAA